MYFFYVGRTAILTNGFVKKSQKTPKREIDLAKKYKHEYLSRGMVVMITFDDYLKETLAKDPELREEYQNLEPEFSVIQAIIDARVSSGMSQQELSKKTGIAQGDISKIERGNGNPSVKTLQRLAAGMGKKLKIEFV